MEGAPLPKRHRLQELPASILPSLPASPYPYVSARSDFSPRHCPQLRALTPPLDRVLAAPGAPWTSTGPAFRTSLCRGGLPGIAESCQLEVEPNVIWFTPSIPLLKKEPLFSRRVNPPPVSLPARVTPPELSRNLRIFYFFFFFFFTHFLEWTGRGGVLPPFFLPPTEAFFQTSEGLKFKFFNPPKRSHPPSPDEVLKPRTSNPPSPTGGTSPPPLQPDPEETTTKTRVI